MKHNGLALYMHSSNKESFPHVLFCREKDDHDPYVCIFSTIVCVRCGVVVGCAALSRGVRTLRQ